MENLKSLSLLVLESIMTDCLIRMETSDCPNYVMKQIVLFKKVEHVLISRRDDK